MQEYKGLPVGTKYEGMLIYRCEKCGSTFESDDGNRAIVSTVEAATEAMAAVKILDHIFDGKLKEFEGIRGAMHRCVPTGIPALGEPPLVFMGIARLVGIRILRK